MGKRCRSDRDAHATRAAGRCHVTSHLPPEIPRPAPRGVHRAVVGRSSGSWTRIGQCPNHLLVAASRDHRPSACATSFPPTAAGQRRIRTGFPFHPRTCARGTDDHKISRLRKLSIDDVGVATPGDGGRYTRPQPTRSPLGAPARHRPAPALRRAPHPAGHRLVAARASLWRPIAPRVPVARRRAGRRRPGRHQVFGSWASPISSARSRWR